jgi:ribosome-associated heat shock protein Hsp15
VGVAQITGSLIDDFGENGAGGPAMQEAQRWRQTTSNESQRPAAIQNPRGKQGMIDNNRMRIDKWLWVARFFKTRSLAAEAISSHKIRCNGEHVKPARDLKVGDELEITIGQTVFVVIVQGMAEQRRPAPEARQLYQETPDSEARRLREQELRKLAPVPGSDLRGRPTKREGRLIRGIQG